MGIDVFISHAHEDDAKTDTVYDELTKAGFTCWVDHKHIPVGAKFYNEILGSLKQSKIVILILSSYSNTSQQVINEIVTVSRYEKQIVPFIIEDVKINETLEIPLACSQYKKAYPGEIDEYIPELINGVKNLLIDSSKTDSTRPNSIDFVYIMGKKDAKFIYNTIPKTFYCGYHGEFDLEIENTGSQTWDKHDYYVVGLGDVEKFGRRISTFDNFLIQPGQRGMIHFKYITPTIPNNYELHFVMRHKFEGNFGAPLVQRVSVITPPKTS
jgi:hypothetical protein